MGMIELKGLVTPEEADLLCKYTLMQLQIADVPEDNQVQGAFGVGKDELFQVLLYNKLPEIEEAFGLRLLPTYAYYRIYEPGDELIIHTDRDSCQITVTMTLGFNYTDVDEDYRFPIKAFADGKTLVFNQEPGDAIAIYGRDIPHWRDKMEGGENSFHSQVFLHYVDRDDKDEHKHAHDKNAHLRRMWEAWVHMQQEGIL